MEYDTEKGRGGLNATGRPHGGVVDVVLVDGTIFLGTPSMAETMQPHPILADSMQPDNMTE